MVGQLTLTLPVLQAKAKTAHAAARAAAKGSGNCKAEFSEPQGGYHVWQAAATPAPSLLDLPMHQCHPILQVTSVVGCCGD